MHEKAPVPGGDESRTGWPAVPCGTPAPALKATPARRTWRRAADVRSIRRPDGPSALRTPTTLIPLLLAILLPAPVRGQNSEATIVITPSGNIDASTYSNGSFQVSNTGVAGGPAITLVRFDLSGSFLPDIVFDPADGTPAGDATNKCLEIDSGAVETGYIAPADPCADPFSAPRDNGYDEVVLTFTAGGFAPGETVTFSVDIDPTSIQGAGGAGGAGSVSGLELSGSPVTVEFDNGDSWTGTLFRTPASDSGAQNVFKAGGPAAPGVEILGVTTTPAQVSGAGQTVRVTGPAGEAVRLLVVEGSLDNGLFDIDPFEANTAVNIQEFTGTIGGSGFVDLPVTLTRSGPAGGLNHVFAAIEDSDSSGRTGPTSPVLVLELAAGPPPISFSSTPLTGAVIDNPTSIDIGPDGRVYVSQQNGLIKAFTVLRTGPGAFQATATETIMLVQSIPNHDDLGALDPGVSNRQVTGLMADGTAANPVLYVTSSDPRIGAGGGGNDLGLDTNSGILSRLTWDGSAWEKVDLVRGLPRSEENHSTNGMDRDESTNILYLMSGGHANKGAPSNNFAQTPEYALSAAMLSVDLDALEAMPVLTDAQGQSYVHDLPTLDDPTRMFDPNDPAPGPGDPGDPFGGNDGRNQAIIAPGGPVQIYAPGFRNAYDVVLTEAGRLYTVDNGPNTGWGGVPVGEGTATCTNATNETGSTGYGDGLHFVSGPGYYGGHPHPTRANPETSGLFFYENIAGTWTLTDQYDWQTDFPVPPVPLGTGNAVECDYRVPGVEDGALAVINASTNGLTEYTAGNFAGQMTGNLLSAAFNGNIYRFQLDPAGQALAAPESVLFSGFGAQPLDLTAQGDGDPFPGTVWVAVFGSDSIVVFEPDDFISCTSADDPALDEDGDGYDNADEIDNGTDPCSGGSKPDDNDGDFISNRNDPDDDNDGVPDPLDPFAIDPLDGTATTLPVSYPLFNADPGLGFFGLGFTGLMANGTTDYLDQFDETTLAAGGAAGLFTVEQVTAGDAFQAGNDQEAAFQFGVAVDTSSPVFSVQTRLLSPYFGVNGSPTTPVDFQSFGMFIGTGDQDNYLKIVFNAQGGSGGIEVLLETAGVPSGTSYPPAVVGDVLGAVFVDLHLTVDPAALSVQPAVSLDGTTLTDLGSPVAIPGAWLSSTDSRGLAVGVIATSFGSGVPFGATWDFFEINAGPAGSECIGDGDCPAGDGCNVAACVMGQCQFSPASAGVGCDADQDACTLDECDGLGNCVNVDQVSCPFGEVCTPSTGVCVPSDVDTDNDALRDFEDPCPGDPRNRCSGPVAMDATSGLDIRINASAGAAGSGTQVDCNGDTWHADFGFNTGNSFQCNLGGGCAIAGLDTLFGAGCAGHAGTSSILQSERWDDPAAPDLIYDLDLPDGQYVVNLLFANTWTGTVDPGTRVFDVQLEGVLVHDDVDPVLDAGGSATAVVRAALVDVADGNGLQIQFSHGVQNPAVKGIEVLQRVFSDADGDGIADADDCAPADGENWTLPGPATGLTWSDASTLSWSAPTAPGTAGAVLYDSLRSAAPGDFIAGGAVCIEFDDAADTQATDIDLPATDVVYHYLVRPENGCGDNQGPLGSSSTGARRTGRACP